MLRLLYPLFATGRPAVALLFLRVFAGTAILLHGLKKAENPFHWMDGSPEAAIAPLQLAAVVAEVGGGIGLILGLLTPLWNLMILTTMAVAIRRHIGDGGAFVGGKGAWELAGMHAAISIVILLGGPGRWSLDFFLFGRRRGEAPPA